MRHPEGSPVEEVSVLLVLSRPDERQELCRRLADPAFRLRLIPVASLAEALPYLEARQADAIVGDLDALAALRADGAPADEAARWRPFCVLVPPGAEAQAVALLEAGAADFLLQAGDYPRLLPALVRRSLRRQETAWEEVARVIRHEMNNPLTGVLGNAELILAEAPALGGKMRERLSTIVLLAVRLRDVVRGLESRLHREKARTPSSPPREAQRALRVTGGALR